MMEFYNNFRVANRWQEVVKLHMRILKISDQLLNKIGKEIKWKRDSRVSHKMHKL